MFICLNDLSLMSKINPEIYICCDFNVDTKTCDSSNYISLYYNNMVSYSSGFENENRNYVSFLKYDNQMIRKNSAISIEHNKKLDVKFVFPIESLDNFFDNDENMNNLVSLDFSNFDSSKITSVENLFTNFKSLKYIDLSNFGESLTSMKGLFKDLNLLESITLRNIKSSKVTSIESMFENCVALESIDLSEIDTTSLTNMNNLFSGCSNLKVIDFTNLNLENIGSFSNIFNGLSNFEQIILTKTKLSDELFSEIKNKLSDKYYYLVCSLTEIIQNGDYKCCNSLEENNCFHCINNKIIFYDKISSLSSKSQILCENIDISKYYAKTEGIKTYYEKCEKAIANCEECSDEGHCTKCKSNY